MSMVSAQFTDIGSAREINQDSFFADTRGNYGIYVVSDGMGGHSRGEIASNHATSAIGDWWRRNYTFVKGKTMEELSGMLEELIQRLNGEIYRIYKEQGLIGGATFSMLLVSEKNYLIFTVGDSRIFQVEKKKVRQISTDDVWENLAENRERPQEELRADVRYGTLTQAIGYDERVSPRIVCGQIPAKTVFFLCSDGVYKYLPEKTLHKLLVKAQKGKKPEDTLQDIKDTVYSFGAGDNMTGILVRV